MLVHLSVAVSLDGYIDDRSPQRLVLSNSEDLADMRELRAQCDAILVGAQTLRRDDPSLRGPKMRATLTESGELDPRLRFFDGSARSIVLTSLQRADTLKRQFGDRAEVLALGCFDPDAILGALGALGVRSLWIEGGTRVLTMFLASGRFDTLRLAIAPFFVGDAGAPRMVDAARFVNDATRRLALRGVRPLGDVAVLDYERSPG